MDEGQFTKGNTDILLFHRPYRVSPPYFTTSQLTALHFLTTVVFGRTSNSEQLLDFGVMMTDSDPFPLPSDQVEEYAPDGQPNEQFMKNEEFVQNEQYLHDDQFVQGVANDVLNQINNEINGSINQAEENNLLWPVLPGESGEGLPYAPIDWPYPGDIWTWRVGRRFNSSGYFQDRFLYLPKRLGKQSFASKNAVANYISKEFPDADIDSFFASFAWKIPAKIESTAKEETVSVPCVNPPLDGEATVQEEKKEEDSGRRKRRKSGTALLSTPQAKQNGNISSSRPKRAKPVRAEIPPPTPKLTKKKGAKSSSTTKRTKGNETTISSTPKRKTRRSSKPSIPNDEGGAFSMQESMVDPIPEDFDNYLNSLEDILTQPVSETQVPSDTIESSVIQNEMAEARSRLSSLLAMDFPSLVSSDHIFELTTLASKLRSDPNMNAEQLVKLKLVEEITSFSEVFLESRELIEQVDEFFATLEAKKAKVASLKNEYSELRDKADQLQSQVDSNLSTVQEIDNQIALLQSRRAELTNAIQTNKAAKVELTSAQKMVANAIPRVVHEIQLANAKIPDLELKKTNAMKREAEILAKFAPLHGFSV
ncbi:hypothetical protein JCGZ_02184 [Jatropha curcas]|uniref:DUF7081 domain-containing protein n=1 Tax=Jatropha curcas TaxID=180498 RepID=A0A067KVF5_JATCU|nr:uncharacterized protein LOC105632212 [Jatropha curcas]KDP40186.1 hypothetical protein JCGZ_02184 [Jatropha curcas]